MISKRPWVSLFVFAFAAWTSQAHAAKWHHVHLNAVNTKEGAEWYAKYMEGRYEHVALYDGAVFGKTNILFFEKPAGFPGSDGSTIDHIGFSFRDLDAKMKEFEAAGIKIIAPARGLGKIKFGFIQDPWGTKIEVMQDPDLIGFHHVHLHVTDPDVTLKWYQENFGGEITKYQGVLPALHVDDIWIIAQKTPKEKLPTVGRSVDHIGWQVDDLDATAKGLKEKNVKFVTEPKKMLQAKLAFIEGPGGVLIELLQEKIEPLRPLK